MENKSSSTFLCHALSKIALCRNVCTYVYISNEFKVNDNNLIDADTLQIRNDSGNIKYINKKTKNEEPKK